jgi:hypothetical protein
MAGRECYHCKQWIEEGEEHDCWTTTEAALTRDLPEDLQDAWERLRETAVSFGDQRIYASHHSIMFSRKACYFFVRPKSKFLEVCVFLGRPLRAPQVRRVLEGSRSKFANMIHIRHRDEVEAPITDWLEEAYGLQDVLEKTAPAGSRPARKSAVRKTPAPTTRAKTAGAAKKARSPKKTGSTTRTRAAKTSSKRSRPVAREKTRAR